MSKQTNRRERSKGKAQETHIDTKTQMITDRHRNPVKSKTRSHYILDYTDQVQSK